MRLIKSKPEETKEKENVFNGIEQVPWWRRYLDAMVYAAAAIGVGEFVMRVLF